MSYKGTNFHGWQLQSNAETVQGVLNNALSLLLKEEITTTGAGRTDTGVHAQNFYAHFDSRQPFDHFNKDFIHHLNCILPTDIAIYQIIQVHQTAHSRYDAISRTYIYRISQIRNPFNQEFALYFPKKLDIPAMQRAAIILMEYSDFTSFCKLHSDVKTYTCIISKAEWNVKDNELQFIITADRFLRNMVRAIVGTLISIGLNKINDIQFRNIIEQKKRTSAGMSVAAHGLHLVSIHYPYPLNE